MLFHCQSASWCTLRAIDFFLFFPYLQVFVSEVEDSSELCSVALNKIFTSCHSSSLKPAAFFSQAAEGECKGSLCDMIEAARYYFLFKILGSATDHGLNEA